MTILVHFCVGKPGEMGHQKEKDCTSAISSTVAYVLHQMMC